MSLCVSCGVELKSPLVCAACDVLQRQAVELDYFALFALKISCEIDSKALTKSYRALSRQVHPDFHTDNKDISEELSSFLNAAYQTLNDRYRLLEYVLNLKGGKSAADDKRTDQTFLMNMMEFQERVEEDLKEDDRLQLENELIAL